MRNRGLARHSPTAYAQQTPTANPRTPTSLPWFRQGPDNSRRLGRLDCFASVGVADQGDGFVTALRVDLLHDSVDVILDSEFGQIQIGGDFLVAQAHGDQ